MIARLRPRVLIGRCATFALRAKVSEFIDCADCSDDATKACSHVFPHLPESASSKMPGDFAVVHTISI